MPNLKVLLVGEDGVLAGLLREANDIALSPIEVTEANLREARLLAAEATFQGIFVAHSVLLSRALEFGSQVRTASVNRVTPIIVLSSVADQAAIEQALEIGGTFFLSPGLEPVDLLLALKIIQRATAETRRRAPRALFTAEAFCRLGSHIFSGTALNISIDGMLFDAGLRLPLVQTIYFNILLPGESARIGAVGRIVHINSRGQLGVQFTSMSCGERLRLRHFVAAAPQ